MSASIVLVAAVALNGVIGRDNRLLWRLKSDMAHFKRLTLGKPMIMGRKTLQSIGRPLPGRTTIVVTRDPGFSMPGVVVAATPDIALALAREEAVRLGASEIIIAGGGEIYAHFLPIADRLEVTRVALSPDGDAFFPAIDPLCWQIEARDAHHAGPNDEAAFEFLTFLPATADNAVQSLKHEA